MQVVPLPLLSAVPAAPAPPEEYSENPISDAAAQRQELELRLSKLQKRKESHLKDSKVLQDMVQRSETQHRTQAGVVQPRQAVSVEARSPTAPLVSPEVQPGRPSVTAQKMGGSTMDAFRGKEMHQKHVSVEPFAAPPTPTKAGAARHVTATSLHHVTATCLQHIKEVDVEPKRRGYRQISTKSAAEAGEDWLSMLIQYLWPKIRQVIEDTAWDTVPRKYKYQHLLLTCH